MANLELADLMESYRSPWEPGYQSYISSKREYFELASGRTETLRPGRGQYFKHQLFSHRYMRIAKRVLVCSQTGTGKSCEVFGFTDYCLRQNELAQQDPETADSMVSNIKQVIVFVRNDKHEEEIRKQIICKCTDERYEKEIMGKATGTHWTKKAVTQVINESRYVIMTPATFTSQLSKKLKTNSEELVYQEYDDTIFVIDEMDTLTIPRSQIDKIVNDREEGENEEDDEEDEEREKEEEEEERIKREEERDNELSSNVNLVKIWRVLYNLFNSINGSRVIGITATPMVNSVNDLVGCLGLLLPKYMPEDLDPRFIDEPAARAFFPDLTYEQVLDSTPAELAPYFRGYIPYKLDLSTVSLEDFEPYLRGRVLYTKALDTGVDVVYMGEKLKLELEDGTEKEYHQVVYPSVMSEYQSEVYSEAVAEDEGQKTSLYNNARNAALFTFQPGKDRVKWGFEKRGKEVTRKKLETFIHNTNDISEYSCKVAALIEAIKSKKTPGNIFIYLDIVRGSGIYAVEDALRIAGWSKFTETKPIFKDEKDGLSYCAASGKNKTNRKATIAQKPRYAVLSGATSPSESEAIMSTMNAYENRTGKYIQILIGSKVAQVALNINNIAQVHILSTPWNYRSLYQAISRAIRATSHVDLITPGERFEVQVYQHVALMSDDFPTIDSQLYAAIEEKDIPIRRMMRFIKRCNMSCIVNKERNRDIGEDGSPACDYEDCDFECFDEPPDTTDNSTYNIAFSDERVSTITGYIVDLFSKYNRLTGDQIVSLIADRFPEYNSIRDDLEEWVLFGLQKLIHLRIRIKDSFGFSVYVLEDKGFFYLDRAIRRPNYLDSWYSENLIIYNPVQLNTLSQQEIKQNIDIYYDQLSGDQASVSATIYTFPVDAQAALLENTLVKSLKGLGTPLDKLILTHFKTRYFGMHVPATDIRKAQAERDRPKRGRKRNELAANEFKSIRIHPEEEVLNITEDKDTPYVYIHQIYSHSSGNTNFGGKARELKGGGRMRLLTQDLIWEDVPSDSVEYQVYNVRFQIAVWQQRRPYEELKIYGFHNIKGTFMLAEYIDTKDFREKKDGAYCPSIPKERLRYLLSSLSKDGLELPKVNVPKTLKEQTKLAKELGIYDEGWSNQELNINLKWEAYLNGQTSTKKKAIETACQLIEEFLTQNNRMVN